MNRIATATVVLASFFALAPLARADVWQDAATFTNGSSRAPFATIEEELRKAPPAQFPELEMKLLAALQAPGTTVDAKRRFIRMLVAVGSVKSVPALSSLLADEQLSDVARLVLEPMKDPAASEALRGALGSTKGRLLAGVIGSVGVRRDAAAVKTLAGWTKDADATVAAAAISALGAIGTRDAAKALATAGSDAHVARARLACANHLADEGERKAALAIFSDLSAATQPPGIREGALVGLLLNEKADQAAALIASAAQGNDTAAKSAALRAFYATVDAPVRKAAIAALPALNTEGQLAMLGALGDMPDAPARDAILRVLAEAKDPAVHAAALDSLITHGTESELPLLLQLATGQDPTDRESAKRVLAQMHRTGISEALAQRMPAANADERALLMGTIVARRSPASLPVLLKMARGNDPKAAAEAAKGIGQVGGPADADNLVSLILAASDPAVRDAAAGSIKAIAGRAADPKPCSEAVLRGLDQAKSAEGRESLVRALADLPDLSVSPRLLAIAKENPEEKLGILALRGCVRLASRSEASAEERLKILRGVLETAKRPDEKREALAALASVPLPEAADRIEPYMKDATLALDAATALASLAKDIGPIHRNRFRPLMDAVKVLPGATDALRLAADEAIKAMNNAGQADGYIIGWLMSGPFTKADKDGSALFDEAFDPEKQGTPGVAWKAVSLAPDKKPCVVRIDKLIDGGNNRVAYLRTSIDSESAQEIQLEAGSDDGIKVWLNGQVVMAHNGVHPCTPGQYKTKLNLKAGANSLLVKVTQGGGEWETCLRLRSTDGKETTGLTVAASLD